MKLAEALLAEHSRAQTDRVVGWIGADASRFEEVFAMILGGGKVLAARAAWVVSVCVEGHPQLLEPHLAALLDNLSRADLHPAVIRATFRMLQDVPLPGELEGWVLDAALAALGGKAPVAAKAYAITVLKRCTADHPAIRAEVRLLIEDQLATSSPAFRARARREFGLR